MLTDVNASSPCFSPDGSWVAFRSRGETGFHLLRVSVDGGTPLLIAKNAGGPDGIAWTKDGQLIYPTSLSSGLVSIPARGGAPTALTHPDSSEGELGHWQPCVLPDDDHVLFTAWRTRMDDARIEVVSRSSKEARVVVENGVCPMYMDPGYLLYVQGATLMCVPFDPERAVVTGDPVPLIDPVNVHITDGSTDLAMGGTNLCYLPDSGSHARLVWADPHGKVEAIVPEERNYDRVSIAPDGRHLALCIEQAGKSDLWVLDSVRHSLTQLTVDGTNAEPIYSPDGRTLTFQSMRRGPFELYSISASSGSTPQLLFPSAIDLRPLSWTPDGKTLLFGQSNEGTGTDVMRFSPADEKISPFIQSPFNEFGAVVSPDGRWVAYSATSSDRSEIYVSKMDGGDRSQISVDGGTGARWAGDGRALYFVGTQGEALYRVGVTLTPEFRATRPEMILSHEQLGGYIESYDVYPDSERLAIVLNRDTQGQRAFRILMNVPEELERRMR
jgi:Tol biopolymer transport system component